MESKAKALGHPIHQMLIPFPLGLLGTAVIFDIIYLIWGNPTMAVVSHWMIAAGIIGGLLSAPFGLIDLLAIPSGTRAKRIGILHGVGNLIVLLLFAGSWYLRYNATGSDPYAPSNPALALSFSAFILVSLTGWLGGELVDRLSVGVDDGANLEAPNSLTGPVPKSKRQTTATRAT
jgi:uncharacterized membrane protein